MFHSSRAIDTPEIGSHAKCLKERKLALIAKGRLKELLAERGLKVVFSGAVDKTPTPRQDVEPEAAERLVRLNARSAFFFLIIVHRTILQGVIARSIIKLLMERPCRDGARMDNMTIGR
ncbi:hypothetical protein [Rhizobium sp. BK008]|uniref:hypothetical protein n=1 Tax=Rhizobium sp. BK008 TaxID=2587094 RepID=UPI0017C9B8CE|nr:hypothetical protein [Rhizobium sp. BK008]